MSEKELHQNAETRKKKYFKQVVCSGILCIYFKSSLEDHSM